MPLNVWDRTGPEPTDEQKAEMIAFVRANKLRRGWEDRVRERYNEKKRAREAARGKKKKGGSKRRRRRR